MLEEIFNSSRGISPPSFVLEFASTSATLNETTSENTTDSKPKKVSANIRSCMPLTLAQIKNKVEPAEDRFLMEGKELTDVCVIGVIRDSKHMQTNTCYVIEDGTATIDVKQWHGIENQNDATEVYDANLVVLHPREIYVKVYGRLQSFSDRVYCVCHSIETINDSNEITFHFLDAILEYLHLLRKKKSTFSNNNADNIAPSPVHMIGKNNINSIVKRAIKVCGDEEAGSQIASVISHLKGIFSEAQVLRSLQELADEGQIYSVADENIHLVNF